MLLAGSGNTAHVFDDFAPRLAAHYRVYGITRRGWGASGFSESKDPVDRLRADLLSVLGALELERPILAGHSIAGAEMSAIANAHPARVAGLIYIDAAYPYAFDDGSGWTILEFEPPPAVRHPSPGPSDRESFHALQAWDERIDGFRTPEAEFRQLWEVDEKAALKMRPFPGGRVFATIMTNGPKYTKIPVPTLAIFALPHAPEDWIRKSTDPTAQKAAQDYFARIDDPRSNRRPRSRSSCLAHASCGSRGRTTCSFRTRRTWCATWPRSSAAFGRAPGDLTHRATGRLTTNGSAVHCKPSRSDGN